ncbi:MAG: serine/threonine protein phosphatase [Ruminococcaceae bacterium]|nr:serine/threonine protein phosphatase [Oscillospiraceae bacterium]
MSLFALSDTHLSLYNDKPMDIFGNRWQSYAQKLDKGWKAVVTDKDTVVIAGDVSWGISLEEAKLDLKYIDSLPGKKIISKGNHDYWWSTASKINKFFEENGITTIGCMHNNAFVVDNVTVCGTRGWFSEGKNAPREADFDKIVAREAGRLELSIKEGLKLSENNEIVVFLHFPPVYNDYVCDEILDVLHKYNVKRVFYGHIHGVYNLPQTISFDGIEFSITSADYLNFVPLLVNKS